MTKTLDVIAAIDLVKNPLRNVANAKIVANSAISLNTPPATFPRRKIIEHPITQVYIALIGPLKSKLIIIGNPVRSHETVPGIRGKGISKGGPFIISDAAARAPNMLANASFLVPSICKEHHQQIKVRYMLNYIYVFRKIRCFFRQLLLTFLNLFLSDLNILFNHVFIFQVYYS